MRFCSGDGTRLQLQFGGESITVTLHPPTANSPA
jgi:hypothetical protein